MDQEDQQILKQLVEKYSYRVVVNYLCDLILEESDQPSQLTDTIAFHGQVVGEEIPEELAERYTNLRCSFCGKKRAQVANLIAGPSAYICVDCIELCNEIIEIAENSTSNPTD